MNTRLYRGTAHNVAFLAGRLRAGELVAAPTETVYGLAANAFDARACRKIFRAKGRPAHDPLIVHIHSMAQLEQVCVPNGAALRLARRFWPGPLTLVLPRQKIIPDIVTAGRDSVAVRMPSHPLFRRLLRAAGVPLAAPSANPFGYVSPTTAEHVRDGLAGRIPAILDGGPTPIGVESTIVDLRDPQHPAILRPGYVTVEAVDAALRKEAKPAERFSEKKVKPADERRLCEGKTSGKSAKVPIAPGMLARHYSPHTPVRLHASLRGMVPKGGEAFLLMRKPKASRENVFWLDAKGDLRRVARRLFAMLRKLDAMGFGRIHAELAPERGIGVAINDRIRRAAAHSPAPQKPDQSRNLASNPSHKKGEHDALLS